MTVAAIIQARTSSQRLPGKVLHPVAGVPLLGHVVARAARAELVDAVVVATSDRTEDDPVAELAARTGAVVVRGSLDDVLGRFLDAAEQVDAERVVRITGDCPLVDWATIDRVVAGSIDDDAAASVGAGPGSGFPRGLDAEAVLTDALRDLTAAHPDADEREHVTLGLHRRPGFRTVLLDPPPGLRRPHLRLCVDEPADLRLIEAIHARLGGDPLVPIEHVVELLDADPDLAATNALVEQRHV